MEVYFDDIENVICKKIEKADQIYICSAWLSSVKIMEITAQIDAVAILTNDVKITEGSAAYDKKLVARLKKSFHQIYIYHNQEKRLMHNKFIILFSDGEPYAIITGSYNCTIGANNNYENIIYVEDAGIAGKYLTEFMKIKNNSNQLR